MTPLHGSGSKEEAGDFHTPPPSTLKAFVQNRKTGPIFSSIKFSNISAVRLTTSSTFVPAGFHRQNMSSMLLGAQREKKSKCLHLKKPHPPLYVLESVSPQGKLSREKEHSQLSPAWCASLLGELVCCPFWYLNGSVKLPQGKAGLHQLEAPAAMTGGYRCSSTHTTYH